MKNLTQAIFAKLAGSSLDTDIGGRLYKGNAPEGAEFPYVVFLIVSDVPEKTFTEAYENVLVQFSLFSSASGSTEIEDMYTHLQALYDECSLTIPPTGTATHTLVWMKRQNATLMIDEQTTPAGTAQVWAYHVDYEVLTSAK